MNARWQAVRKCLWWIGQTIPPLLILPLAATPLDLPTAILWIIGWIACAVSLVTLARIHVRWRRFGSSALKPSVRPTLTIIFMLFAHISIWMSQTRANEFGRNAARRSIGGVMLSGSVLQASQIGLQVGVLHRRRLTPEHWLNIAYFTV